MDGLSLIEQVKRILPQEDHQWLRKTVRKLMKTKGLPKADKTCRKMKILNLLAALVELRDASLRRSA